MKTSRVVTKNTGTVPPPRTGSAMMAAAIIFFSFACLTSQPGDVPEYAVVAAPAGLTLRDKPSTKGTKIEVMPLGSKVIVLDAKGPVETIDGITGVWHRVKNGDAAGWAFGGFLLKGLPLFDTGKNMNPDETEKMCAIVKEAARHDGNGTCFIQNGNDYNAVVCNGAEVAREGFSYHYEVLWKSLGENAEFYVYRSIKNNTGWGCGEYEEMKMAELEEQKRTDTAEYRALKKNLAACDKAVQEIIDSINDACGLWVLHRKSKALYRAADDDKGSIIAAVFLAKFNLIYYAEKTPESYNNFIYKEYLYDVRWKKSAQIK